jgi:hypothetical protein
MFDIVVVVILLGLTLLAVTKFPAEGGAPRTRIRPLRPASQRSCAACRAPMTADESTCLTCGRSVGHELHPDGVSR